MNQLAITPDLIVSELHRFSPETIPVFLKYKMGCVGCVMAHFETISDVVSIYQLSLNQFMFELNEAVQTAHDKGNCTDQ